MGEELLMLFIIKKLEMLRWREWRRKLGFGENMNQDKFYSEMEVRDDVIKNWVVCNVCAGLIKILASETTQVQAAVKKGFGGIKKGIGSIGKKTNPQNVL